MFAAFDLFMEYEVQCRWVVLVWEPYDTIPHPQEVFHPVITFVSYVVQVAHCCERVCSCMFGVELSGHHPAQFHACDHPVQFVQAVVLVYCHVFSQVPLDDRQDGISQLSVQRDFLFRNFRIFFALLQLYV